MDLKSSTKNRTEALTSPTSGRCRYGTKQAHYYSGRNTSDAGGPHGAATNAAWERRDLATRASCNGPSHPRDPNAQTYAQVGYGRILGPRRLAGILLRDPREPRNVARRRSEEKAVQRQGEPSLLLVPPPSQAPANPYNRKAKSPRFPSC